MNYPIEGWNTFRIDELASVIMGQSPGGETINEAGDGLSFVQGKADLGMVFAQPKQYTSDPKRISEPGEILLTVRAPVGYVCKNNIRLAIGRGISSLAEIDNSNFLYYALQQWQKKFLVLEQGTTFTEINQREIKRLRIPAPESIVERKKISGLLEAVDNLIYKTYETIDQAQQLKKALMQHLLSGRLKPDGTWRKSDEFYVDEKFGLVPIDWQVMKLKDFGRFTNGINFKADQMGTGKLFVNLDDIFRSKIIDCSKLERVNVNNTQNLNLIPGDLVFVRSSVKLEGIGLPSLFTGHTEDIIFCGFVIRYRYDQEKVFPKFLLYLLLSEQYRRKTISLGQIAANTNISQKALGGLRIAIPKDYQEQEQIAYNLNQIDNFIEIKKYKITKIEKLKKSLLQNLLTGKIRVQTE